MSSPDSFDYGDVELNPEVLSELLVIETTQLASTSIPFTEEPNPGSDGPIASTSSIKNELPKELPPTDPHSDDLFDPAFVLRVTDLEGLDAIEQHYRNAISLPNRYLHLAQSLITSRGDGRSPSPDDEPSTSRRGTQHKSSIHSIDHKVKQLDLTALVKSDAKRKARNSDDEGDEEGEKDTRRRPTLKRQRGCGPSRRSRKPPSRKVRHIKAVTTDTDTRSGIDLGVDSDDPIDFLRLTTKYQTLDIVSAPWSASSRAFGSKCLPSARPPHILLGTEDGPEVLVSMMFATTHHRAPTDPMLDLLPFHSHLPFGPLPTAAFTGNLDAPSRLPRWECSLPPSSLLYDVLDLQVVQALPAESQVVYSTYVMRSVVVQSAIRSHLEFPELVAAAELSAGPHTVVEVGCGAGNAIFPLLEQNRNPELRIHAFDYSSHAIKLVQHNTLYTSPPCGTERSPPRFGTYPPHRRLPISRRALPDILVLVFILSALHPSEWPQAISNIAQMLKPGGLLLMRDYEGGEVAHGIHWIKRILHYQNQKAVTAYGVNDNRTVTENKEMVGECYSKEYIVW
ncbi:hypothetical protein EDB84DRAFT_1443085 [Lactarius hengduanensis]|nr:hypothetical protein EDB84DRAFT_1443085 [Lactarius hengduanensis]